MNLFELQQAVYVRLNGDATLGALITGVFEDVPAGQEFAYVTLGEQTAVPDDLLIEHGEQMTQLIQVWDRGNTFQRVKQIMARIDALLHAQPMTISGTQTVSVLREMAETLRDPDGETRRGVMRYRVSTFG